jgi:hypothetical protein
MFDVFRPGADTATPNSANLVGCGSYAEYMHRLLIYLLLLIAALFDMLLCLHQYGFEAGCTY